MKNTHSSDTSKSCSCTSCVYRSESDRPSLRRIIAHGSKIDKLYFGKYIPLREKNLLEKLVRTRAVYDDVRSKILSCSSICINKKTDLKAKKNLDIEPGDTEKSSALFTFVDSGDKGAVGASRISDCCSCCSCSSKIHVEEHKSNVCRRVHRHPSAYAGQYLSKSSISSKHGLLHKSRKKRAVHFKAKHIRSDPCTCTLKLSSFIQKKSKPISWKSQIEQSYPVDFSEVPTENIKVHKKENIIRKTQKTKGPSVHVMDGFSSSIKRSLSKMKREQYQLRENIKTRAKKSLDKMKRTKPKTRKLTNGTALEIVSNIEEDNNFNLRKDSIAIFKDRLQRKKELKAWECDLDCLSDECVPDNCFRIIKRRRLRNKEENRHISQQGEETKIADKRQKKKNIHRAIGKKLSTSNDSTQSVKETKSAKSGDFYGSNNETLILLKKDFQSLQNEIKDKPWDMSEKKGQVKASQKTTKAGLEEGVLQSHKGRKQGKRLKKKNVLCVCVEPKSMKKPSGISNISEKKDNNYITESGNEQKQVVRIGSSISFNLEFYKETLKHYQENFDNSKLKDKTQDIDISHDNYKGQLMKRYQDDVMDDRISRDSQNIAKGKSDQTSKNDNLHKCICSFKLGKENVRNRKAKSKTISKGTITSRQMTTYIPVSQETIKIRSTKVKSGNRKPPSNNIPASVQVRSSNLLLEEIILKSSRANMPYICLPDKCDRSECKKVMENRKKKYLKRHSTQSNTHNLKIRSTSSLTSSLTPSRTKKVQSSFDSKADFCTQKFTSEISETPNEICTLPITPNKQVVKITSSFSFNVEFLKDTPICSTGSDDDDKHKLLKENIKIRQSALQRKRESIQSEGSFHDNEQAQMNVPSKTNKILPKTNWKKCFCAFSKVMKEKEDRKDISSINLKSNNKKLISNISKQEENKEKSTFVNRLRKCFCTSKSLSTPKLNNKSIMSSNYSFNNNAQEDTDITNRSYKTTNTLKSYECQPNICITRECDPLHCVHRSKKKYKSSTPKATGSGTIKPKHKSSSSLTRQTTSSSESTNMKLRNTRHHNNNSSKLHKKENNIPRPRSNKYSTDVTEKSSNKITRIGSNFSFDIEFYKIKNNFNESRNSNIRKHISDGESYKRITPRHKVVQEPKPKYRHKSSTPLLKRCLCTLQLQQRNEQRQQQNIKPSIFTINSQKIYTVNKIETANNNPLRNKWISNICMPLLLNSNNVYVSPKYLEEHDITQSEHVSRKLNTNDCFLINSSIFSVETKRLKTAKGSKFYLNNETICWRQLNRSIESTFEKETLDSVNSEIKWKNSNHILKTAEINPFSNYFYTMNIQVTDKKKTQKKNYELEPYECEPGICVPGECDPVVCQKRIKQRLKKTVSKTTDTKSNALSAASYTPKQGVQEKNIQSDKLSKSSGDRKKNSREIGNKKFLNAQQKQIVKVGSNFSFNIEFYRQQPLSMATGIKNIDEKKRNTKSTENDVTYNEKKMQSKERKMTDKSSSSVGPALKRCLCTLKLQNKEINTNVRSKKQSANLKNTQNNKIDQSTATKTKKDKPELLPYECEPEICVPGECDPHECLKLINKRNKSSKSKKSDTQSIQPKVKSEASAGPQKSLKEQSVQSSSIKPPKEKVKISTPTRRAVKIASSFSIDIEFSKDKSDKPPNADSKILPIKDKNKREKKDTQTEPPKKKMKSTTSSILNRCFCTLKLQKGEKENSHKKLKSEKSQSFLERCFCVLKSKKTENKKDKKDSKFKDAETETSKKKPSKSAPVTLEPYECEPGVCVPGQCDPYQCEKLIKQRLKNIATSTKQPKQKTGGNTMKSTSDSKSIQSNNATYKTTGTNQREKKKILETKSPKQALRIGSTVSFNIEFYKDRSAGGDNISKTSLKSTSNDTSSKPAKNGKVSKMQTEKGKTTAAGTDSSPKRCFCTLALKKSPGKVSKKKAKEPSKPEANKTSTKATATKFKNLLPYECEPGFCIPGQCDPMKCLERIKTRNLGTTTEQLFTKSVATGGQRSAKSKETDANMRVKKSTVSVETSKMGSKKKSKDVEPQLSKQSVRISSSLSFDIEFNRQKDTDETNIQGNENIKKTSKVTKDTKSSKNKRDNTTQSKNSASQGSQAKKMKNTSTSGKQSRCFCTLELLGKANKSKEPVKEKQKIKTKIPEAETSKQNKGTKTKTLKQKDEVVTEPYECEPGVCVPYECDPYQCLKRIQRNMKKSQMAGTDDPKKKSTSTKVSKGTKPKQFETQTPLSKNKYSSSTVNESTKKKDDKISNDGIDSSKQVVRVGSTFKFDIEFFKNKSDDTMDNIGVTNKQNTKPGKNGEKVKQQTQENKSQLSVKNASKSSSAAASIKRCFCTLELQKKQKVEQKRKPVINSNLKNQAVFVVAETKKKKTRSTDLDPNECEPGVCIPGKCNPYECLKRIQQRRRQTTTQTTKKQIKYDSTCTLSAKEQKSLKSKCIQCCKKEEPIKNKSKLSKKQIPEMNTMRRAVKIASSFNLNIEFSKGPVPTQNVGKDPIKDKAKKVNQKCDKGIALNYKPTDTSQAQKKSLKGQPETKIKTNDAKSSADIKDKKTNDKKKNVKTQKTCTDTNRQSNFTMTSCCLPPCKGKAIQCRIGNKPIQNKPKPPNVTKVKKSSSPQSQAVKLGSNINVNIEFYKKRNCSESVPKKTKTETAKIEKSKCGVPCCPSLFQQMESKKVSSKVSNINKKLKRCFCTLNLQKSQKVTQKSNVITVRRVTVEEFNRRRETSIRNYIKLTKKTNNNILMQTNTCYVNSKHKKDTYLIKKQKLNPKLSQQYEYSNMISKDAYYSRPETHNTRINDLIYYLTHINKFQELNNVNKLKINSGKVSIPYLLNKRNKYPSQKLFLDNNRSFIDSKPGKKYSDYQCTRKVKIIDNVKDTIKLSSKEKCSNWFRLTIITKVQQWIKNIFHSKRTKSELKAPFTRKNPVLYSKPSNKLLNRKNKNSEVMNQIHPHFINKMNILNNKNEIETLYDRNGLMDKSNNFFYGAKQNERKLMYKNNKIVQFALTNSPQLKDAATLAKSKKRVSFYQKKPNNDPKLCCPCTEKPRSKRKKKATKDDSLEIDCKGKSKQKSNIKNVKKHPSASGDAPTIPKKNKKQPKQKICDGICRGSTAKKLKSRENVAVVDGVKVELKGKDPKKYPKTFRNVPASVKKSCISNKVDITKQTASPTRSGNKSEQKVIIITSDDASQLKLEKADAKNTCYICPGKKDNMLKNKKKKGPCICGSSICARESKKTKQKRSVKPKPKSKPCICENPLCGRFNKINKPDIFGKLINISGGGKMDKSKLKSIHKTRKRKAKETKKVETEKHRAKEEMKRKAVQERKQKEKEKRDLKEYKAREKIYEQEDKERRKKRKIKNKVLDQQTEKYKKAGDLILATDSVFDVVKMTGSVAGGLLHSGFRVVSDPKQSIMRIKHIIKDPGHVLKNMKHMFTDSDIVAACARIKRRILYMTCCKTCRKKLDSYAVTNFLMHATDKDIKKRTAYKKIKKKAKPKKHEREPLEFGCSLFMGSLRKRPHIWAYYLCPWFYPHFLSMLAILKQITDVLLFLLAVVVWSPCIIGMELCRGVLCCMFCTA